MYDATFKICIFGDGGVGKTTLTERYLMGIFKKDSKMTLGTNFYRKTVSIEGKLVSLQIWDFGGEKEFQSLFPKYVAGTSGAIFMYDITRYSTIKNLKDWIDMLEEGTDKSLLPLLIVGGKSDLEQNRAIDKETAEKLRDEFGFIELIECSAKTGENVEYIFQKITQKMMENANLM